MSPAPTPTPRMQAARRKEESGWKDAEWIEARKLERELTATKEQAGRLAGALVNLRSAKGRHNTKIAYDRAMAELTAYEEASK